MELHAVFCRRPATLGDPDWGRREQVYRVWKQVYGQAYAEQGRSASFFSDAFLRYDVVLGLWDGENVVGANSFAFFDFGLESVRDHSYARTLLTGKSLAELDKRGISRVMTFESFFIAPDYREHKTWLADLLTHLGLDFYHGVRARHGLQAAVTAARISKHMHEVAQAAGFALVRDDLFYNGEPAALLLYTRESKLPPADSQCRAQLARLENVSSGLRTFFREP